MTTQNRRIAPRPQLSDDVSNYVRDLIVSGQVRAGEFLRLESLAAQLGTSVTPVREALVSLRGDGFVILQPRRGFMVAPFTKGDILDIYQVQAYLAGELAARACTALSADDLAELRDLQAQLTAAHGRGEAEAVEQLNHEFHRAINVAAAAPKLSQFLVTATRYSPRLFFAQIAGWTQASAEDHEAILAAFAAGDPERARIAMAQHVSKAGELLADHLEAEGMWREDRDSASS
ncbi:MAG TPA: GntR family transcriptional regulator [Marmoricola sp.]|jgi:DNA-binding GntR family transcriptional regulator|nr:GntR family transcriptional regulator [Marmoricola sp.]